jgi:hypothetical protein
MTAQGFSWPRLFGGAALGAICGVVLLFICADVAGQLLGGDEPAGTAAFVMILWGAPVALVVGAVLGGRVWGYMDRRLLAAVAGAFLGVVLIYLLAIPVSIVYGGAEDRTGVLGLLGYGGPIAVFLGARWGWRRFDRARHATLPE